MQTNGSDRLILFVLTKGPFFVCSLLGVHFCNPSVSRDARRHSEQKCRRLIYQSTECNSYNFKSNENIRLFFAWSITNSQTFIVRRARASKRTRTQQMDLYIEIDSYIYIHKVIKRCRSLCVVCSFTKQIASNCFSHNLSANRESSFECTHWQLSAHDSAAIAVQCRL